MNDIQLSNASVDSLTSYRSNQWQSALNGELQHLIEMASICRKAITTAKTETKKKYYSKKFKKIQAEVMQMLVVKQRVDAQQATLNAGSQNLAIHDVQIPLPETDASFSIQGTTTHTTSSTDPNAY